MRRRSIVIVLVVLALVAGIGGGVWWAVLLPAQRLEASAARVAAGLASGTPDDADFTTPVATELARVYAGMGSLRPAVEVASLDTGSDGSVQARLDWSWVIHQGKPAWEYTTTIRLDRAEGGDWRAVYAPEAVAPGLLPGEALRATRLTPVRGAILGQRGEALASNTPALRLGIDKTTTDLATATESARKLADLLGLDPDRLAERVTQAGPRAFIEARILRAEDRADVALANTATQWIGVRAFRITFPLGRTSTFARPILGVVGEATAEQVEKSGGTIRAGDLVGRGGLQEARNHVLGGTTGFAVAIVDARGRSRDVFRVEEIDGADVQTTIDVALQTEAERLLADVGPASALVAIRPSDGAILAAASGPGSEGYSTATLGQYAPGSTFKVVTSLALLRSGLGVDSPVSCTDGLVVDGYRFDNWQGYPASSLGEIPLREALAWSCNSAFLGAEPVVGVAGLAEAAGALGLGVEPSLVVPGFLGAVPSEGTRVEHTAAMIGQGRVLASPLGMATVAASVAAGRTVSPVLVDEPGRAPASAGVLGEAEASALRELMGGVVADGTASALGRLGPGAASVLGAKTGTASWGPAPPKYHGWLIAYSDDLAVATFIEDAPGGAGEAIAVTAEFLESLR